MNAYTTKSQWTRCRHRLSTKTSRQGYTYLLLVANAVRNALAIPASCLKGLVLARTTRRSGRTSREWQTKADPMATRGRHHRVTWSKTSMGRRTTASVTRKSTPNGNTLEKMIRQRCDNCLVVIALCRYDVFNYIEVY